MNDKKNSHDNEPKHNVCPEVPYDVLELTEKELETYIEFLQNVYDNSRE